METETQTPTADPSQEGLNEFDEVMDLLRAEAATDDVPEAVVAVEHCCGRWLDKYRR